MLQTLWNNIMHYCYIQMMLCLKLKPYIIFQQGLRNKVYLWFIISTLYTLLIFQFNLMWSQHESFSNVQVKPSLFVSNIYKPCSHMYSTHVTFGTRLFFHCFTFITLKQLSPLVASITNNFELCPLFVFFECS